MLLWLITAAIALLGFGYMMYLTGLRLGRGRVTTEADKTLRLGEEYATIGAVPLGGAFIVLVREGGGQLLAYSMREVPPKKFTVERDGFLRLKYKSKDLDESEE